MSYRSILLFTGLPLSAGTTTRSNKKPQPVGADRSKQSRIFTTVRIDPILLHLSLHTISTLFDARRPTIRLVRLVPSLPPPTFHAIQPTPSSCMYSHLVERRCDAVKTWMHLLRKHSGEMALDPRFYRHLGHGHGPGSISSATSSESSAFTGITSPSMLSTSASAAVMRSTASSPSLRARESVSVPINHQDGVASPSPGGNVRVVVRVRKFLPRGMVKSSSSLSRSGVGHMRRAA